MSRSDDLLTFIDVWDEMLTDDGKPNPDLYVDDGLHMNEKGMLGLDKAGKRKSRLLF